MDYMNLPLFSLMKAKMNYASARHEVLAQNIANVDTPGYRARDIEAPDFKDMLAKSSGGVALAATNPKHISNAGGGAASFRADKRPYTYEQSPVGNNVVAEEEMMRISQNQGEYQKALNLYRKTLTLFKTALGSPNAGM